MAEGEETVGELAASPAEETTSPVVEEGQSEQTTEEGAPPTPPAEPAGEKEPPFNTHPRWIERQRELEELREQNRQLLTIAQQRNLQPPQPQADPLQPLVNHQDPATAQFWQQVQTVARHVSQQTAREAVQPVEQYVQLGRQELATMTLAQFRRENPDIAPGSAEEAAIARLVAPSNGAPGLPLEYAKRVVMYDHLTSKLQQQKQADTTKRQVQKRVATPEATAGQPASAGGPARASSFRERMDAALRGEGL